MARNSIKQEPREPKLRRRAGGDLYEGLALVLWLLLFFGMIIHLYMEEQEGLNTFDLFKTPLLASMLAGWMLCSIALFKFDRAAVKRERKSYSYQLTHFEMLRTQWLEQQEMMMRLETEAIESKYRAPSQPLAPTSTVPADPGPEVGRPESEPDDDESSEHDEEGD